MEPRTHIYARNCWQAYFKSIGTLSRIFKNHMPIASDVFPSKNDSSGGKTREAVLGFIRYNIIVIACGYRKYKNVFTHEYHIHLGNCPWGI
jgi:hypothetical protein